MFSRSDAERLFCALFLLLASKNMPRDFKTKFEQGDQAETWKGRENVRMILDRLQYSPPVVVQGRGAVFPPFGETAGSSRAGNRLKRFLKFDSQGLKKRTSFESIDPISPPMDGRCVSQLLKRSRSSMDRQRKKRMTASQKNSDEQKQRWTLIGVESMMLQGKPQKLHVGSLKNRCCFIQGLCEFRILYPPAIFCCCVG